jgi:hypothetical protein
MSDLISRQQAIDAVEKSMYENPHENEIHRGMHDHEHRHFLTILMGLPSIQPERKTGRWIQLTCDSAEWWYCSECNEKVQMNPWMKYNYCPNCGADMRGEQE